MVASTYLEHTFYRKMTRQTWTTTEQKDWLESRKAAFIEAKQKGNAALRELFFIIFREFREKWPVPPVTEDETTKAGSSELATKIKCARYDKVCVHSFILTFKWLTQPHIARARMVSQQYTSSDFQHGT